MENWERALNKFVDRYQNEDYFEGAIVCGSYVSGNNNEFSDIDVHLVLKRGNEWRERGNLEIDGFLIEYFANPVNKYESIMEEEKNDSGNSTTKMFAQGKIVIDKHGEVEKLKERSMTLENVELPNISEFDLLSSQYRCWDKYDEFKAVYLQNRDSFYLAYYELYKVLLDLYGKIKKIRKVSITKLDKLLDSKIFRDKYGISKFYDEYDTSLIRECMVLDEKDKMFEKITKFYDYVQENSGGFDISKFILRSEVK